MIERLRIVHGIALAKSFRKERAHIQLSTKRSRLYSICITKYLHAVQRAITVVLYCCTVMSDLCWKNLERCVGCYFSALGDKTDQSCVAAGIVGVISSHGATAAVVPFFSFARLVRTSTIGGATLRSFEFVEKLGAGSIFSASCIVNDCTEYILANTNLNFPAELL